MLHIAPGGGEGIIFFIFIRKIPQGVDLSTNIYHSTFTNTRKRPKGATESAG